MNKIDEKKLSSIFLNGTKLRKVEPNIFSVLPNDEFGNEYDSQFGYLYDLVACNPIYNRLIWGYSVRIFSQILNDALQSASKGYVLDLGCGSLAFTSKAYSQQSECPVILSDQSLKMLRMAKSRLIKQNGKVPENLVFLHSDAVNLQFRENVFSTIISENLLHCLEDTEPILEQLKKVTINNGKLFFTTLVKSRRWADKYLQALADSGKLISRTMDDHKDIFKKVGLSAKFESIGNMLSIQCEK